MSQMESGTINEWWKDSQLMQALENALNTADWRGLIVGSFGVRIATDEDAKMTIRNMCATKISSIRKDAHGLDIFICSPAGALELFVRGEKVLFLPMREKENENGLADIQKQIGEFGDLLRQSLLG
jgi:hypothetical protein